MTTARRFLIRRDVIVASGVDAATYLHSQLTNDVASLTVGDSRYSFILQPTGKIVCLARVCRTANDVFEIDTDEGAGAATIERLQRFRIRVKCDLVAELRPMWALRGLDAATTARALAMPGARRAWGTHDGAIDVPARTDDVNGDDPAVAEVAPIIGDAPDYEALRVRRGWPRTGSELTADTMVAETDLAPVAVSFTKGCYPGQELVERMDSRGAVAPRKLVVLSAHAVSAGDTYVVDGEAIGHVTSAAGGCAIVSVARAHLSLVTPLRPPGAVEE